jgi:hypothetical protein
VFDGVDDDVYPHVKFLSSIIHNVHDVNN